MDFTVVFNVLEHKFWRQLNCRLLLSRSHSACIMFRSLPFA